MKSMVWMLISLMMILTLTGCSKESMTLSRMTLPENQMEEQAINQSVQGKSENHAPQAEEQAYYTCNTSEECQYSFSFWRLEEGKWMESKLNEGSLAPGDHNFTVYLSNDEGGYGAGAKTMKNSQTVYYQKWIEPMDTIYRNKSEEISAHDRVILAVGGKNASGLKPEIISDINELKNLEDNVYLLTLTLS